MRFWRMHGAMLSVLATVLAFTVMANTSQVGAQVATPAASPAAGGVPCTNLFGIALGNACVIVFHGSPDAGPVDVYVDQELILEGVSVGVLGDFVPVVAGERQIQIVPSGGVVDSAILDSAVDLGEGIAYELAVLGTVDDIRLQPLPVDTRPLAGDASRVRVVHAAPDAPAIDLALVGGEPVIQDLESGEISDSIELPADTYELEARVAGTSELALPLPGTVFAPATTYTVYVTGLVEDGSLGATLIPVFIAPEIAAAIATPVS